MAKPDEDESIGVLSLEQLIAENSTELTALWLTTFDDMAWWWGLRMFDMSALMSAADDDDGGGGGGGEGAVVSMVKV